VDLTQLRANPLELTEYAYFRTEGPPGLATLTDPASYLEPPREAGVAVPETDETGGQADRESFDSGLDDLTRYVRQTVPATVPGPGERPLLPKPVYRAYDVGVEFNETYVDLLYWRSRPQVVPPTTTTNPFGTPRRLRPQLWVTEELTPDDRERFVADQLAMCGRPESILQPT
jgi:hypothetical protein